MRIVNLDYNYNYMRLIEVYKSWNHYTCEDVMECWNKPTCHWTFENIAQVRNWCGDEVADVLQEKWYVRKECDRRCWSFYTK